MTNPTPARGRFIVLEGIDGCGKTTQLEALQ
jgi:thymidylate kinase